MHNRMVNGKILAGQRMLVFIGGLHSKSRLSGINQIVEINGQKQMLERVTRLYQNARSQILIFTDAEAFAVTVAIETLTALKAEARQRGIRLRFITEITKENLQYCKKQMTMVDELRHLDGAKGNFALSEKEFMLSPEISARFPLSSGCYCNYDNLLQQYWHLVEAMWVHSIPAEDKIRQFEGKGSEEPAFNASRRHDRLLDRFYVCAKCGGIFIYAKDARGHQVETGHTNMKEYPIG